MSEIMDQQHERPPIMILNDDCFYNIMAKLHILDLMQLKKVNRRLNDLCLVQLSRCKELNLPTLFPETLKNEQFRQIADWCSLSLISMVVPIQSNLTFESILDGVEKCGKLKSLKVTCCNKTFNQCWIEMQKGVLIGRRISLSVQQLDLCVGVFCLTDVLKAFPSLEELRFSSVIRCRSVDEENYYLGETMMRNKLKSLEIYAHNTDESIPLSIVPSLPMLEKFHLACKGRAIFRYHYHHRMSRYINFSGNKKLKEIHMMHWVLNDNGLLKLGNSIYGQLETLGFHYCSNITGKGFKRFLRTQPNLKTVDIRSVDSKQQLFMARWLNYYMKTRPVMEEPLTVITTGFLDTRRLSPKLNIVQVSGRFECAFCERS